MEIEQDDHTPTEGTSERKKRRFVPTGSQILLGLSLLLFIVGAELLVSAYFPEASITKLLPEEIGGSEGVVRRVSNNSRGSTTEVEQGEEYPGLSGWTEPLLEDAQRGFGAPGQILEFEDFNAVLSFDPSPPVAGEQTDVIWTFTDKEGAPFSEWDRSVHRTLNHSYLVRTDFQSKSFHVHPGVREDGTMTESIRFPVAGEWGISAQLAKDATTYVLTSVFDVENADGTTESRGMGQHTPEEITVTGARGVDFSRTLELKNWDIEMVVEGGEPVVAGEPAVIEWVAHPRDGSKTPKLEGGILDGGHNILIAHTQDPSLIWNTHGDRSVESVSHLAGLPTYRWPTRDHPFKYTYTFTKPGIWWIHWEVQSSPVHFFIDVAENPNGPVESAPIEAGIVQGKNRSVLDNVVDFFTN